MDMLKYNFMFWKGQVCPLALNCPRSLSDFLSMSENGIEVRGQIRRQPRRMHRDFSAGFFQIKNLRSDVWQ